MCIEFSTRVLQVSDEIEFPSYLVFVDGEILYVFPGLSTDVGEPQKVERLRLACSTLFSTRRCEAPKFDQARLVWVQLQTELPQALPPMDHHDFLAIQPANKKFAAEYSEHTKIAVFA